MTNRPQGPNVKMLIVRKMSFDAIPDGGGFLDGIRFITDPDRIRESARKATEWAFAAIDLVKAAHDNHYGDDDEVIAGEILRRLEAQKRYSHSGNSTV